MTDDLDRMYERRFGTTEQASKEDVWDPIVDFLERFFVDGPVLDIASDRGYFIRHAPGTERWATDLRNVADSLPPDVRFVQGDGLALREVLPADYFAVAFLSNYLEHLPSRDAVVEQLWVVYALLRPGGRLALHAHNLWLNLRDPQGRLWLLGQLGRAALRRGGLGDPFFRALFGPAGLPGKPLDALNLVGARHHRTAHHAASGA